MPPHPRRPSFPRLALALLLLAPTAQGDAATPFFTAPRAPFLTGPGETVLHLPFAGGPAADAQKLLDEARSSAPDAILVLDLAGTLTVSDRALQVGERTCLNFAANARVVAAEAATAPALLRIERAGFVAIAGAPGLGLLDGRGVVPVGIDIVQGGRIHLDRLDLRNCTDSGLRCVGRGADRFSDPISLTRSSLSGCRTGATVRASAHFVCLDSTFTGHTGVGLDLDSPNHVIAGCQFVRNGTGLAVSSVGGTLTRNLLRENRVGLLLAPASQFLLIHDNTFAGNPEGVVLDGTSQTLYENRLADPLVIRPGAKRNLVLNHAIPLPAASLPAQTPYFHPPTAAQPHQEQNILPGLGRFDLTVNGSADPAQAVDLATAQKALDQARAQRTNDVIVLHLRGHFTSRSGTGLRVRANTCVVLAGSITAALPSPPDTDPKKSNTQLVLLDGQGFCSFSGGLLDGAGQIDRAVNAPGPAAALVEGVTVLRTRADGISTKGRLARGSAPLVLRDCTVRESGGRGIWVHVARSVFVIGNTCEGNHIDGIDIDAYADRTATLFNTSRHNGRHGVFVEEAVKNNLVLGNLLANNTNAGLHVWNELVPGNTGANALVANLCSGNLRGISVGGRAADRTANGNFFFNNICRQNREAGLAMGNRYARDNYFGQTTSRDNPKDVVTWDEGSEHAFFNAPPASDPSGPPPR